MKLPKPPEASAITLLLRVGFSEKPNTMPRAVTLPPPPVVLDMGVQIRLLYIRKEIEHSVTIFTPYNSTFLTV
jgi:hypothetical protein